MKIVHITRLNTEYKVPSFPFMIVSTVGFFCRYGHYNLDGEFTHSDKNNREQEINYQYSRIAIFMDVESQFIPEFVSIHNQHTWNNQPYVNFVGMRKPWKN
jgi:hypothetical protein